MLMLVFVIRTKRIILFYCRLLCILYSRIDRLVFGERQNIVQKNIVGFIIKVSFYTVGQFIATMYIYIPT